MKLIGVTGKSGAGKTTFSNYLKENSKDIEVIHIDDLIKLCNNNIGNKYLTPNKNIKILVKNHKIYFTNEN